MKRLLPVISTIIFLLTYLGHNHKSVFAETMEDIETVVVHADRAWQRTDIILKGSSTITWQVDDDDYWSFNKEMFPEGHNADGIPVPALESYALPGEKLGMLLGKIGDGRIISMGLSGSDYVRPDEAGNYFYLTINDDLIGKYGEGYKNNIGEIKVTIIQTPIKVVKIDILFIKGCPGYLLTKKYIEEIVFDEAVDAKVSLIQIDNDEDAGKLHFIGSPTVRVEGKDIDEDFKDNKDYGVKSRLYHIEGNPFDHPSKNMLRDAIKKAELAKRGNSEYFLWNGDK